MKIIAYKVVKCVDDRYFSIMSTNTSIHRKISKRKSSWACREYKIGKWTKAHKNAPRYNKDLFVFSTLKDAKNYNIVFARGLVFKCEVDILRLTSDCYKNNIYEIRGDSVFCTAIKLIEKI